MEEEEIKFHCCMSFNFTLASPKVVCRGQRGGQIRRRFHEAALLLVHGLLEDGHGLFDGLGIGTRAVEQTGAATGEGLAVETVAVVLIIMS